MDGVERDLQPVSLHRVGHVPLGPVCAGLDDPVVADRAVDRVTGVQRVDGREADAAAGLQDPGHLADAARHVVHVVQAQHVVSVLLVRPHAQEAAIENHASACGS